MFTKIRTTMLALAAVASLALASLVTSATSADARPGFGGGGGFRGGHVGMRHVGGPRIGGMRHIGIRHVGHRPHFGHRIRVGIHRPHWCHRFPWRCKIHVKWPRPIIYGAPVIAAAATTYAAAPVAPRCTCLTKEYTPDGLVVFQDVCTKEMASAPTGSAASLTPAPQTELQQPAQPQVR